MLRIFVVIACFFLSCGISFAADDRFAVEIKVDVTDENASIAREKAMKSATRAAITAVARRISTQDGASQIANMTDPQLLNFVKETSVVNERNSDVRYIADLRIIINEELLKEYMKEREIPLLGKNKNSILVIPLFREFSDDTPMLWENDNLWKQAWDTNTISSAIQFIPIKNSSTNTELLTSSVAEDHDQEVLEKVMTMAGANEVFVLDASYNGVEGLNITAISLNGDKHEITVPGAKSSGMDLFNNAVIETSKQLEKIVLSQQVSDTPSENELTILYPFSSLGQWITAEQKIKEISEITNIQIQAMAQGKAQLKILYTGSLETIMYQFKAKGYLLEDGGNYKILKNIEE